MSGAMGCMSVCGQCVIVCFSLCVCVSCCVASLCAMLCSAALCQVVICRVLCVCVVVMLWHFSDEVVSMRPPLLLRVCVCVCRGHVVALF